MSKILYVIHSFTLVLFEIISFTGVTKASLNRFHFEFPFFFSSLYFLLMLLVFLTVTEKRSGQLPEFLLARQGANPNRLSSLHVIISDNNIVYRHEYSVLKQKTFIIQDLLTINIKYIYELLCLI